MIEPDRTAELVRAMLVRRSAGPAPAGLLDGTMHEVVLTRRARGRPGGRSARVVALVLLFGVIAVAAAFGLAGGIAPARVNPTAAGQASAAPTSGPSAPASSPTGAAPASTPPGDSPGPAALRPGMTAIVTTAGDGLRVRTAPGVGQDYTKLSPLLRSGTRLLILLGPVEADGYDWYQVTTDADPGSGWVAAGKGGVPWIAPASP